MAGDRVSGYNASSLFLIFILLYVSQKGIKASAYHPDTNSKQQESAPDKKFAVMVSDGEVMEYSPNKEDPLAGKSAEQNVVEEVEVDELDEKIEKNESVEQDLTEDLMEGDNEAIQVEEVEEVEETEDIPVEDTNIPTEQEEVLEDSNQIELSGSTAEVDLTEPSKDISDMPLEMAEEIEENQEEVIEDEPVLGGQSNLFLKPTVMSGLNTKKQQLGPKISFKYSN